MNAKALLSTTVAALVFGLASVAGSQPDQKPPEPGSEKHPAKEGQRQQQHQPQGKKPQQQAPDRGRQGQPPARDQQRRPPDQGRQRQPSAQDRQQRPPAQGRQQQPAPTYRRQPPGQTQPQRPSDQRRQPQGRDRNPQQQPQAPDRNRFTPPQRQVSPTQQRSSGYRVEHQQMWPRYRARSWNTQHRTWVQRGGYNGYRIPAPQFSLYFGRPHRYHLSHFQVRVYGAYPQFYANGYWFTMLDPVPEYWHDDWYDTDYVTILEMQDGYYLVDEGYPQARIAISIQLR